MSKYTLTIEGNFEKGDCYSCPLALIAYDLFRDDDPHCMADCESENCPLEEVKQGEWMDDIVKRLEAATESVYNEMKGDYFDYIKTADAIEILKGGKR